MPAAATATRVRPRAPSAYPPGPRERYPKQTLLTFRRDPLQFLLDIAGRYGDLAHFRLFGRTDCYLVNDPELIQRLLAADHRKFSKGKTLQESKRVLGDGLLTSEGELHHRQRRLIQPSFNHKLIDGYADTMVELTDRTQGRWREGDTIDVHREMYRLTLSIIGQTLFTTDVSERAGDLNDALTDVVAIIGGLTLPYSNIWEHLPVPRLMRMRAAVKLLNDTAHELVVEHRADPDAHPDMLTMLLRAQRDGAQGLTDTLIQDEAMTLFLAGHETTANLLTWSLYRLSRHPEIEAKLHAEVDSVLDGRTPTIADVPNLRYTDMILHESLRYYPPVWSMPRLAIEDYELDGFEIRPGSLVIASAWVTQHDERWYPGAFDFVPERWAEGEAAARPRYSYFPFGGGPRLCIGERFAWLEATLALARIAQSWRLRLAEVQRVDPAPHLTLRPRRRFGMIAERRT